MYRAIFLSFRILNFYLSTGFHLLLISKSLVGYTLSPWKPGGKFIQLMGVVRVSQKIWRRNRIQSRTDSYFKKPRSGGSKKIKSLKNWNVDNHENRKTPLTNRWNFPSYRALRKYIYLIFLTSFFIGSRRVGKINYSLLLIFN